MRTVSRKEGARDSALLWLCSAQLRRNFAEGALPRTPLKTMTHKSLHPPVVAPSGSLTQDEAGVDLTLIRAYLDRPPIERLRSLQNAVRVIARFRRSSPPSPGESASRHSISKPSWKR